MNERRSTGFRWFRAVRSTFTESNPAWPASCSSVTPWWRATGTPTTGSRRTTPSGWTRWPSSNIVLRRDDLLITDEALADLYSSRLPDEVVSVRHFDRWWRQHLAHDPSHLDFRVEDLIDPALGSISADDFPESWSYGDLDLALHYEHDAASLTDGVSIDIPFTAVSRVDARRFDWLVAGLRRELVTELLRTLPKPIRRLLVPIPATVDALLPVSIPAPMIPCSINSATRLCACRAKRCSEPTSGPRISTPISVPTSASSTAANQSPRTTISTS